MPSYRNSCNTFIIKCILILYFCYLNILKWFKNKNRLLYDKFAHIFIISRSFHSFAYIMISIWTSFYISYSMWRLVMNSVSFFFTSKKDFIVPLFSKDIFTGSRILDELLFFQYLKDVALPSSGFLSAIILIFLLFYLMYVFLKLLLRFSPFHWFYTIWLQCALVFSFRVYWIYWICRFNIFIKSGTFLVVFY